MIEVKSVVPLVPANVTWEKDGISYEQVFYIDYVGMKVINPKHPYDYHYDVPEKEIFEFILKQRKPSVVPVVPQKDEYDANNYQAP